MTKEDGDCVSLTRNGDVKAKDSKDGNGEEASVPFYKLFVFADSVDMVLMIVGTVAAVANGLCMPLMTVIFGQLINSFGMSDKSGVVHAVSKVSLKFVYLGVGAAVVSFLQVSCWMITGERQAARIRSLYLSNILRQDIAFFDKDTNTGEVIGRMSGDTILIQDAMGEKVGKAIQLVSTFFGGFVVAFIKGWRLALVMMASIPLIVFAGAAMALVMTKLSALGQAAYANAGVLVEQTVGSIRTVASFTGEKEAIDKYNNSLVTAYLAAVKQGIAAGLGVGCVLCVVFCSYAMAMWYGSKLIIHNGYNGGQVINVMVSVMMGGMSLGQASPCMSAFAAGSAAAYKMFETIERKPEIDAYSRSGVLLEDLKGEIELKDVHFSYPARPDVVIFSGFSLHVPSGTTAALVGESGSGKSTVVGLVERFYDPLAGEVLIDGVNLKKLQLGWIREKIGLVSQEPVLFATTIKENISYGKVGATLEEIKMAAELANAAKFINKMPQGLDTMVGEHGTQLSGGQKQRIAIARAILKNPRILLLDEATSALDAESERIVQDALTRIMVGRTTIVIAHRLSTIRNADLIAVVHRGKIVEQGSHLELTKDPEGPYSQLIRLQEINQVHKVETTCSNDDVEAPLEHGKVSNIFESERDGIHRSTSRGSSPGLSGRHSSMSFNMHGGVGVHESRLAQDVPREDDSSDSRKPQKKASMSRLVYLNKPEFPILLLGCVFAAMHGVIFPIFGLLFSSVINTFYEPFHQLQKDASFWALMFVVLGVSSMIVAPIQSYLFGVAGGKLVRRIRDMSFKSMIYQEISWFDDASNSSGAIGARLSGDAATVRGLVGDTLSLSVQNISTVVAGVVIAFDANWELSLIVLALLPLIGMQSFAQMRFLKGFSADAKAMYEEASQVANDAVSSIRTVASFCSEQRVMNLYQKKCEAPKKNGIRQGLVSGTGFGLSFFVLFSSYALCFYAGARLEEVGKATFKQIFRVFFALSMTAISVSQTSALAPDAGKAKASAVSIFTILDRKPKIDASNETGITLPSVKGDIEFQHVNFRYQTRPDMQIFRDLSLLVPSGKTVALVGESGSGKSTVVSLLERFYDPDSGLILVDGIDIQKFQLKWLRQQIGLVSQEPILFNETIRANIAYGKQGVATEEEIIEAAKASNAHRFISALPQGYDTHAGERGVQLSGGQKQRIAIARAIIKDPKILLLDEATSALDAESECIVQEALDRVMVNRSTIVVAHRLSTIQGANMIAVVKNGVIAEKGKHESLMKIEDGVYASLVALHMKAR